MALVQVETPEAGLSLACAKEALKSAAGPSSSGHSPSTPPGREAKQHSGRYSRVSTAL